MSEPDDPRDERTDSLLGGARPALRGRPFARGGVCQDHRRGPLSPPPEKVRLAASLLGCYLAGMATTGIWRPTGDGRLQPSREPVATSQEPPSSLASSPRPVGVAGRRVAPEEMSRAELLRRSADRRLLEHGDVKLAVRGYEHFLDLSSAEQRAIPSREDNWLLMALKDARSKEMKHVPIEQD